MGALTDKCIPWGNDFSFDFDSNDRIVAYHKYHKSFIPIQWESDTLPETVMHSHTIDNPYVTATDVCTFLLYGTDLYGLDQFWVYSPYFKGYWIFSAKNMKIMMLTLDALNRINKAEKKSAKKRKK